MRHPHPYSFIRVRDGDLSKRYFESCEYILGAPHRLPHVQCDKGTHAVRLDFATNWDRTHFLREWTRDDDVQRLIAAPQ